MDYIHLLSKRGKVIGVKNTEQKLKIVISLSLIYYFLYFGFIVVTILAFYFLSLEELSKTLYTTAFLIVVYIAITKERNAVFINVSYPIEEKININGYNMDYVKNTVRIYLTGQQPKWKVNRYNYILDIIENNEAICSIRVNYSNENKIHKFIDNLIFADNEIE